MSTAQDLISEEIQKYDKNIESTLEANEQLLREARQVERVLATLRRERDGLRQAIEDLAAAEKGRQVEVPDVD